jgi:predicted Rdx family selenoprotein
MELICRAPRATWIQTELFLTFPTPAIKSIALIPLNTPETGGRFRVWLDQGGGHSELLWDRKVSPVNPRQLGYRD